MKRLDLYVIKEMIMPMLIGTFAVVLMFQINEIIALFKDLQLSHVPPLAVAQYILFRSPAFLKMTLPVGISLASSLTLSRLTRESELTAMRASGLPVRRILLPVMAVGVLVGVTNFFLVERVMPASERAAFRLGQQVLQLNLIPPIKSNVAASIGNYTVSIGNVVKMSDAKLALSDVLLIERRPPQTPSQKGATSVILQAATGEYDRGVWTFQQPYVRVLAGEDLISARPGKDVVVRDPINIQDFLGQPFKEAKTISDLHLAIDQARKLKGDTKALEIELCERYSIPFSCFVFSVLGPVLAIMLSRSGAFVGVFMSLIMVMVYYNAYVIFGQIVGKNGWVPPIVAAWTPNVIFLLIGIWMLRRVE